MTAIQIGQVIAPMILTDVRGKQVSVPQPNKIVHLQFRRFSACPLCNLAMVNLAARKAELDQNGIVEVVFFYSTEEDMNNDLEASPFSLIADPQRKWYKQFNVKTSLLAVLNPIAWPYGMKGAMLKINKILKCLPRGDESMLGLPAEFLIDETGRLIDLKYGSHAYDQWTVDQVIEKSR
jgi:hypothetical protein